MTSGEWHPASHRRERARKGPPGEPLYTREEIAAHLGVDLMVLHGAMIHHPGLDAWHDPDHGKKLYRLTDAVHWWTAIDKDGGKPA